MKISGNVCKPFSSEIVNKYYRHFFKFIQRHYKVYPDRRQFKNICGKKCERNCYKPHKYGINDHSKSGITTTSEAAAYKTGINTFSNKTPGRHNDKNAKIINGRFCQLIPIEIQYQRANRQNNSTSDEAYNNGYSGDSPPDTGFLSG